MNQNKLRLSYFVHRQVGEAPRLRGLWRAQSRLQHQRRRSHQPRRLRQQRQIRVRQSRAAEMGPQRGGYPLPPLPKLQHFCRNTRASRWRTFLMRTPSIVIQGRGHLSPGWIPTSWTTRLYVIIRSLQRPGGLAPYPHCWSGRMSST